MMITRSISPPSVIHDKSIIEKLDRVRYLGGSIEGNSVFRVAFLRILL